MKCIEVIPTKIDNDTTIIKFLEENILSKFGFPKRIVIDNAKGFKSKNMIKFFHDYHIPLGHFIAYCTQWNGSVESLKKSLAIIIKRMLEEKKGHGTKN